MYLANFRFKRLSRYFIECELSLKHAKVLACLLVSRFALLPQVEIEVGGSLNGASRSNTLSSFPMNLSRKHEGALRKNGIKMVASQSCGWWVTNIKMIQRGASG